MSTALVDTSSGNVVAGTFRRLPLDADGTADQIIGRIVECAGQLRSPRRASWGVAIPGPFDYASGMGLFEDVAKFGALNGVDVRRRLLDGLRGAAAEVVFLNDADAFLLGEWIAGAASGHRRAAAMTLGTGVGSSYLADGVIIDHGPDVPPEGRVDLLEIDGRPLEETVSRRALLATYASLAAMPVPPMVDVRELAGLALHGDVAARQAFEGPLVALGRTLAPWLVRFDASVLVVGGSIARAWELVDGALRRGLNDAEPGLSAVVQVLPSSWPDESALVGAAANVIRQQPSRFASRAH